MTTNWFQQTRSMVSITRRFHCARHYFFSVPRLSALGVGRCDEQRQQRLGARRASRRLESHDQHEQRLQNRRVSDRLRRDQESQEEHDQRLQRRRERDALARQEASQEQHELECLASTYTPRIHSMILCCK